MARSQIRDAIANFQEYDSAARALGGEAESAGYGPELRLATRALSRQAYRKVGDTVHWQEPEHRLVHGEAIPDNDTPMAEMVTFVIEELRRTGARHAPDPESGLAKRYTEAIELAEQIRDDPRLTPTDTAPAASRKPARLVPDDLPTGDVDLPAARKPTYRQSADGLALVSDDAPPNPQDRDSNKKAETKAIEIAQKRLAADGWTLARDCQRDGCGYDLAFVKGERDLHVEVKGIKGSRLVFNLTAKEHSLIESDADFVVIAVTNVLSDGPAVHLLTRSDLAQGDYVVTAYRVAFGADSNG